MLGADTSTITVLGIETSCDETGIALFQGKRSELSQGTLLAERVHSQTDTHQAYGGVVPELAAREHTKSLPVLTDLVLREAGINLSDIDLIGVTTGPGLKGCLLTGILFAQGLALRHEIPLGAVNHLEGHILSVILDNPEIHFPFISLIVSGGHTELHYVSQVGDYALIARTSDDAAGEAFDKSANLLGIPYPGGAALAELADSFHGESRFTLPTVMRHAPGFSFSGLKTAISLLIEKQKDALDSVRNELAWTIQESIVQALVLKTARAMELTGCSTLAVSGGVSANRALASALQRIPGAHCYFPKRGHSIDNAAMIAYAAFAKLSAGKEDAESVNKSEGTNFRAKPRWPVETRKYQETSKGSN